MSAQETKRLAQAWYKALNEQDLGTVDRICSDDVTLEYPGSSDHAGLHRGKAAVLEMLTKFFKAMPEFKFDLQHLTAENDTVAVEWLIAGNTWDGRKYSNRGCSVIVVRDGKLVERREYPDTERSRGIRYKPE
ncbi:MAG: nuclear transport factor 2 family protein [Planctomycetes bacterium]|nr:nuclear transport factor 2 family protein [Planctomycetota bacterium]